MSSLCFVCNEPITWKQNRKFCGHKCMKEALKGIRGTRERRVRHYSEPVSPEPQQTFEPTVHETTPGVTDFYGNPAKLVVIKSDQLLKDRVAKMLENIEKRNRKNYGPR